MGYHTDFVLCSTKKKRGEEVSLSKIASSIFTIMGPAAAAFVIILFSFKVLFIVVGGLLFLSVIPLLFSGDIHEPFSFSLKKSIHGKDMLAFLAYGIEDGVYSVVWPLFIFSLAVRFPFIGMVKSLALFSSLGMSLLVSKIADSRRRTMLRIGALLNFLVWMMKVFVTLPLQIIIMAFFHGFLRPAKDIPFDALSYDKAAKDDAISYIVFREISIQVGRAVFFFAMTFMMVKIYAFVAAGAASLFFFLF